MKKENNNCKEELPIDRLIIFYNSVKKEVGGQGKFEKYCGISNGYLNNTSLHRGSLSTNIISRIFDKFPELNIEWLITGKGNMTKNNSDNIIAQINENISLIKELLDEKDKEIEKLKKGKM